MRAQNPGTTRGGLATGDRAGTDAAEPPVLLSTIFILQYLYTCTISTHTPASLWATQKVVALQRILPYFCKILTQKRRVSYERLPCQPRGAALESDR